MEKMTVMVDGRPEQREVDRVQPVMGMSFPVAIPKLNPGEAVHWVFGSTTPHIVQGKGHA